MQQGLFDNEYKPFGEFPDDYPLNKYSPLHKAFSYHKANVDSGMGNNGRKFFVDLTIGECDCQRGQAWGWNAQKDRWYPRALCSHKLKVMASIVDEAEDKEPLFRAYINGVGTRYNVWEVTSAFHKELRRGDFNKAFFWGLILGTKRGTAGIFRYMVNIIYEETRDHVLAAYLIKINGNREEQTFANIAKAIRAFCLSIKKWEIPERKEIFFAEMEGYKLLVQEYGKDVAKGSNIIDAKYKNMLLDDMKRGFNTKNLVRMQHGLKGLQKLQCEDLTKHRYWLYEQLYDYANTMIPYKPNTVWDIIAIVNDRISSGAKIGYHELNAIADAIAGETVGAGSPTPRAFKAATSAPKPPYPLGIWPPIPAYAFDTHTYRGKAFARKYADELKPGVKQEHLDFRYNGTYHGVCWRTLAFDQFKSIQVKWEEVKWPIWVYNQVDKMWY